MIDEKNIDETYEKHMTTYEKKIWCPESNVVPGMDNILAALIGCKCIALVEAHYTNS